MASSTNLETFSALVNKRSHDECWEWLGQKDKYGRGLFRSMLAHEFCWIAFFGQIAEGTVVLHKCNYTSCVNPYHLYTVETPYIPPDDVTAVIVDYKLTRPGSHEWKEFWREHPELQEEMLAWRNDCNNNKAVSNHKEVIR